MLQVSRTSCMLLDENDTTYQEHQSRFLKKLWQRAKNVWQVIYILQRFKNVWQVNWRRCCNVSRKFCKVLEEKFTTYPGGSCKLLARRKMLQVSGTSCMLLDEDDTTYQEHQSRFLKKLWQRASNVLQITCKRFRNVSRTCCKSIEEDVTTYLEHFARYLKKKCNVSGRSCKLLANRKMLQVSRTSCMLLDENDTTYQEHQSRFLKKLWQRASNVVQVTCRRFHNVSRMCCKSIEEDVTTYQENFAKYLKKSLQRIRGGRASYLHVGRCCKYQERLACYWTKMIQHTRNINQDSWRSCDNVPRTSGKLFADDFTTYHERVANQ